MPTYAQLRDKIAAYMHRPAEVFNFNGQDMLLQAVNNAKNFAQRVVDFELSRIFTQLPNVSATNGADISGLQLYPSGTAIVAKSLEQAFMATSSGTQFPVDFISRDSYVNRLRRRYDENFSLTGDFSSTAVITHPVAVVQVGSIIYYIPASTTAASITLYFDAIRWLPDFSTTALTGTTTATSSGNLVDAGKTFITTGIRIGDVVTNSVTGASASVIAVVSQTMLTLSADIITSGQAYSIAYVDATQTNFLLDYCFDFMMFRSIYELNFYLKEDSRVELSDKLMENIWDNVQKWNATIIGNTVSDNNLD
jgi:hypothetical protein